MTQSRSQQALAKLRTMKAEAGELVAASRAAKKTVHKINLVTHDGPMMVPKGMSLKQVDTALHDLMAFQEAEVHITENIPGFIWDGALAFTKAMAELFGWAEGVPTPGFFGDTPPKLISVEVGLGQTAMVQWGEIKVPGIEGKLIAGAGKDNGGRWVFQAGALVKRKHEEMIRTLFELTKEIVKQESIYLGQAVRVQFSDTTTGQALSMPTVQFLDLAKIDERRLVYSEDVQIAIEDSLFTPLEQPERVAHECGGWKRGVLLAGKFGTGKTLGAMVAAKKAVASGVTFVYLTNPQDVQDGIRFALQYEGTKGAAVFLEDVDRVVTGDRSVSVDQILNIVDGFESKGRKLMTVLTTNNVEQIQQAALRPGRLDAIIEVKAPDAAAVQKLIRLAAGPTIGEYEDLTEVGKLLDGNIPAVIEEVVKRAKLGAIRRTPDVDGPITLNGEDLIRSGKSMRLQLDLLNRTIESAPDPLVLLGRSLTSMVVQSEEFKQVQRIVASNEGEQLARTTN